MIQLFSPGNVGQRAFLFGVASLLLGCSLTATIPPSGVALSKENRSSIRSVSIAHDVALPYEVRCVGNYGGSCGGAQILQAQTREVGRVVRDHFEATLRRAEVFPSVVAEGGDAEFTLWARRVILMVTPGICGFMGNCFMTFVEVEGVLRTSDGTILWQQRAPGFGPRKHALREYRDSPELLREDFAVAARAAVERLVDGIEDDRP